MTPLAGGVPGAAEAFRLDCDTVLLCVGLMPENELSKKLGVPLNPETGGPLVDADLQTSVPGVFACGNVLHVHDLVDFVTEEARRCGGQVGEYLAGEYERTQARVPPGANVRYVVPNRYFPGRDNRFYLRSAGGQEPGPPGRAHRRGNGEAAPPGPRPALRDGLASP